MRRFISRLLTANQLKGGMLGLLIGIGGCILAWSPAGFDLEERYGLGWRFWLRGPITAPSNVVIVTLDRKSARQLGFSGKPDRWPRSIHARLIDRLRDACAKTIVFDLYFRESRLASDDGELARSMKLASNVALISHLGIGDDASVSDETRIGIQTIHYPVPLLADAAAAVAPFILPNTRHGVTGFWSFITSAGSTPSLPVVVAYLYLSDANEAFFNLWNKISVQLNTARLVGQNPLDHGVSLETRLSNLRGELIASPRLGALLRDSVKPFGNRNLLSENDHKLLTLIDLLESDPWLYLNYYGPPGTIKSTDYRDVLLDKRVYQCHPDNPFYKKIVFIGISEPSPVEQKDKDVFQTVFQGANGRRMSGIEIMATAASNLIANNRIRRIDVASGLAIVFGWGLMTGILWRSLKTRSAIIGSLVMVSVYFAVSTYLFQVRHCWLPLTIPLLQTVLGAPFAFAQNRAELDSHIKSVHRALQKYLPASVIDQVVQAPHMMHRRTGEAYGSCLHTDMAGFTALCADKEPLEIKQIMADYYRTIARPVTLRDGIVADQTGDAMLALWVSAEPDIGLRHRACDAALAISEAIKTTSIMTPFNSGFPTRIGMHAGRIAFSEIRFDDTQQLRGFGDIVNLSQRIESLNKILGTKIPISEGVAEGLSGFIKRPMGTFLFRGTKATLNIHELMGRISDNLADNRDSQDKLRLCSMFSEALTAYSDQHWLEAGEGFLGILARYPDDGLSQFYLKRTVFLRNNPGTAPLDSVIHL